MTYINLDALKKEMEQYEPHSLITSVMNVINAQPSIDFEEMIKEMIEEMRNKEYMYDLDMVKIDALQELLNKLPK